MKSIYSNLPNDIIMKIIKEATLSDTTEYWNREKISHHINLQNKINNILTRISFIVRDKDCYTNHSELIKNFDPENSIQKNLDIIYLFI